jgi:glycosyltransferase involved in cell wall biosynthesis
VDRLYLDLSARYHVRVATRLLAISKATKDDLVRIYGVPPERVAVTYLAADESYSPVEDLAQIAAAKARHGIAGEYLLFVGTLQPRKNLVRLVQAFAEATGPGRNAQGQSGLPNLQLVVAGKKGWWYSELFSVVKALGLGSRVVFPGYVAASDLPALYSGSTAFVFPSLYEGFGMPALEAMACGTPVLASNVSSLPEVVGDAGILVDPTDTGALAAAMRRLVDDSALRAELRQRGLARASRFSWERCAHETLAVFREALAVP